MPNLKAGGEDSWAMGWSRPGLSGTRIQAKREDTYHSHKYKALGSGFLGCAGFFSVGFENGDHHGNLAPGLTEEGQIVSYTPGDTRLRRLGPARA